MYHPRSPAIKHKQQPQSQPIQLRAVLRKSVCVSKFKRIFKEESLKIVVSIDRNQSS